MGHPEAWAKESCGPIGSARVLARDSNRVVYRVRCSRLIGTKWVILVPPRDGRAVWNCLAGLCGYPCSHAGAALHAEREGVAAADAELGALIEGGQW